MTDPAGCPFSHLDGAYVLGSLSPAERAEYERHLVGCAECARGVRELAGLPGLLARVPQDVLETTDPRAPVPENLLPTLVAEARRTQRRRAARAAILSAAAAVLVVGGTAAMVATRGDRDPTTAPPPASTAPPAASTAPAKPMTSLGAGSVTGWVSMTSVAWGTRLDLTCSYAAAYPGADAPSYALFVRTTDGAVEQVATWQGVPGEELRLSAATAADAAEIASVVVRTTGGEPVLRLPG